MIIYGLIVAIFLSSIAASTITILAAPYLSSVPNIPDNIMGVSVIILGVLGGYATELDFNDAIVAIVFGLLGYFIVEFGFSKVAVVMALVLGKIMQVNYFLTMDTMGPSGFFARPIPLIIICLCLFLIAKATYRAMYPLKQKSANLPGSGA
jgi:putative tricarboxylic transport membrane protein